MSKEEIQKVWSEISDHKSQISKLNNRINYLLKDKMNSLPIKFDWKMQGDIFNYLAAYEVSDTGVKWKFTSTFSFKKNDFIFWGFDGINIRIEMNEQEFIKFIKSKFKLKNFQ